MLRGVDVAVPAFRLAHINSQDILEGNPAKGVTSTVVAQPHEGEAGWALVTTPPNVWVTAYVRSPEGFVTGMSDLLDSYVSRSGHSVEQAAFFNPGSNRSIVSVLRIVNSNLSPRVAVIAGYDAYQEVNGEVRCSIGAQEAVMLTAKELEEGPSGCSGRLGDGTGKWRIFVYPPNPDDTWFTSMSLLWTRSGIVTNISHPEPYHFTTE